MKKNLKYLLCFFAAIILVAPLFSANTIGPAAFDLNALLGTKQFSQNINLLLSLAVISLIPFLLISTTSFLRVVIVLGFVRSAIGTQQTPPSPVLVSIAVFLTMYIMTPTWQEIQRQAIDPYNKGVITQKVAWENGTTALKGFMLRQAREKDIILFISFSKIPPVKDIKDVPMYVLIPAFIISELTTAFKISFVIFLPFVVVDMVVSNILLSLGMFMLSPVMVSLPFKILLFVLADGWFLITKGLVESFR